MLYALGATPASATYSPNKCLLEPVICWANYVWCTLITTQGIHKLQIGCKSEAIQARLVI